MRAHVVFVVSILAITMLAFLGGLAIGDQLGYAQARRFDARWYSRP